MFKGTRELVKFLWPIIECGILATLIGKEINDSLAAMILIFAFIIFINFFYKKGYFIRLVGWGTVGLFVGPRFYLMTNALWCLGFMGIWYFVHKITK